jgi:hypothetical protein
MNHTCHHCKQPIPPGEEKHIRILGRALVSVHQTACPEAKEAPRSHDLFQAPQDTIPDSRSHTAPSQSSLKAVQNQITYLKGMKEKTAKAKPKTFKSFAEAVEYIDREGFPNPL